MRSQTWAERKAGDLAEQIVEECGLTEDLADDVDNVLDAMTVILTEALLTAEKRGRQKERKERKKDGLPAVPQV